MAARSANDVSHLDGRILGWVISAAAWASLNLGGCIPPPPPPPPITETVLISNKENTTFMIRAIGGEWQMIGKGKIVTVPVPSFANYEISAEPDEYVRKTLTVAGQFYRELRFDFWDPMDRKGWPPAKPPVNLAIEVDVHVLGVNSETKVAVHGRTEDLSDPRKAIEKCAEDMLNETALQGKRLAVLYLRPGEGADAGLGVTAYGMLVTALHNSRKVMLTEREQLGKILSERGLKESDLVGKPALGREIGRILGADFLVTGVISKVGLPAK